MEDFEGLPDERLAGLVNSYFWYEQPLDDVSVVFSNVVAMRPESTQLTIEGQDAPDGMMWCAVHDPAIARYSKGAGGLFAMRLQPGAFDRLFHVDPRDGAGVMPVRDEDTRLAHVRDSLAGASLDARGQFAAADRAMLALLDSVKPRNQADALLSMIIERQGDVDLSDCAAQLGCTLRTLERACAARFGRTPKRIARGVRAGHTFARETSTGERAETLVDFAYADLAHYLNDLRKVTGVNRTQHARDLQREMDRRVTRLWRDGSVAESDAERAAWDEVRRGLFSR